jgi:hypothetical protein
MEFDLRRTVADEVPAASRRWRLRPSWDAVAAAVAAAPSLLEVRHVVATATIILLLVLVGSSPQL